MAPKSHLPTALLKISRQARTTCTVTSLPVRPQTLKLEVKSLPEPSGQNRPDWCDDEDDEFETTRVSRRT